MVSKSSTHVLLEHIRTFVWMQKNLIQLLQFPDDIDELSFRSSIPKKVYLDGAEWSVMPHGIGIRFTNRATAEVVDAPVGFVDAPNSFDAWRLSVYFDSKKLFPNDEKSWILILEELARNQAILPCQWGDGLYSLPVADKATH
jgi:hypothetical protein